MLISDMISVCRDAFVTLTGAVEIRYRQGDSWRVGGGEFEHPIVPRLRSVSLATMTPEKADVVMDEVSFAYLESERASNARAMEFIARLEDLCVGMGMDMGGTGEEVLVWLKTRLSSNTE